MATLETQKITVTLPRRLLKELDAVVPPRERSQFIAQAVQEQLAILEQAQVVDEAAGAWQDEAYPELDSDEKIEEWLAQLRQGWLYSIDN
jgi:metal-responsive CopG/Arc/MetJ family transcriptional regulator